MKLDELSRSELIELYPAVIDLRKKILNLVQKYGFSTESLISREFEHEIEMIYGRKVLNAKDEPDYTPLDGEIIDA